MRDPEHTKVLVVALPEPTQVHEAQRLAADLQRAGIHPYAWIVNQSLAATGTGDPVLAARAAAEHRWIPNRARRSAAISDRRLARPVVAPSRKALRRDGG